MWEPDYTPDDRDPVEVQTPPSRGASTGAGRDGQTSATQHRPRAGWTTSDERAWEHRQLALALEQSENEALRIRKKKAARGSTVDADYLFALSLAQQMNGPPRAAQQGAQAQQPAPGIPVAPQSAARHSGATSASAAAAAAASPAAVPSPVPAEATPAKKKGLLRSLSKSLRRKSSKSSTAPSVASDDSASTIAGSSVGQPDNQWQPPAAQLPGQPVPLSRQSPLGHPSITQQPSRPSTGLHTQDEHSSPVQQEPLASRGPWPQQGQSSPMSASPGGSTPVGVSPSESHDDEAVRQLATASPVRWAADNRLSPTGSPATPPMSGDEAINESAYRELLLDTQMLRQDLEKTLADKQHTMRRLEARGVELQADMHSVRHRIDDPAGWEAFSLYSQQQADLEGRLRLGKRQEDLLQSCMKQLQDLQAFVYASRPHPQDVVQLQDVTFSELLRRLQKLDVDPQLPLDVAAVAAPANGDAEDATSQIRAVCQSSANIDFAAALRIASIARTAKEHQAGKDHVQAEAPSDLQQDVPAGEEEQEHWQPPEAAPPRASWHLAGALHADEFEDATSDLDDDLPDADYAVPHVAGPFSFQGRHAAAPSRQPAQPESSPVPPMSESQSPMSVSDQDDWAAADAAADSLAAGFDGPSSMSRDSSYEEPEYWTPVYGAAASTEGDASPAAADSLDVASAAEAAAARLEADSSDAAMLSQSAPGAQAAADSVDRPHPDTHSEVVPESDAVDAELEARLAALSHRPSSVSHSTATSPATAAAPTPADGGDGRDLAQVLREAEARFLASGGDVQEEYGAAAVSTGPQDVQMHPQQARQPDGADTAAGEVLVEAQLAADGSDAAEVESSMAQAAEASPAAEHTAASAEPASGPTPAAPMPEVPSSQATDGATAHDADAAAALQELPADEFDGVAAVVSPAQDEVPSDQHAAPLQEPAADGDTASGQAVITAPAQQIPLLQRQEGGSGSFSFPAPAAIAAAAVGTSPREPLAASADADTEVLEAATSDGTADQPVHELSEEQPQEAAASFAGMTAAGSPDDSNTESLVAAEPDAPAEQPAHEASREEAKQAASSTDRTSAALEQAMPQPDAHRQTAPMAVPAAVMEAMHAGSPAPGSPASNGSYDRAAERRKREERQAALEAQRQALAERRKLRGQSGGSAAEVFGVPETPVVPPKDAKARVRFAVEEGEAPGDKPLDPEVTKVSPRSALKQTAQPSLRTPSQGRIQRTSPPSARPPAGMRSRGSQEQLAAMKKAENIRRQLQEPVDIKRMTRIEKQFALMELQYLLGTHRASDRRQADALDQRMRGTERAGSSEDLARLPEAERSRIREQRRRERDRERSRAGSTGGGGTPPGRRTSSDGASVSGSEAGSGSVSASSAAAGRSPEGRITRRSSIPTMPGNAGLRTVSIPSGSPGSGGLRSGATLQVNGSGSLDGAHRSSRRSSSRNGSHDGSAAAVPAASLSEEQLQALALEYKNLALDIRDFEALDLQDAARMLQRMQTATRGKPSPAALGIRAWPTRKATALQEVVADWTELQHLTSALKQWRMLPDFSCLDEGTRIETYLNVAKQTTNKMALGSADTQQRFAVAGVPWSPDLLQGVRRAAMQPAKLYLERVLREVGNLGNTQSARANAITLVRSALRLGMQVQQFTGGLDRDVSVLLKRVQNIQATIRP